MTPDFEEIRTIVVQTGPETVWRPVVRLGGADGWHCADALWRFRARVDRWLGGPGDRPRRDPDHLLPGDVVGMWTVVDVRDNERLVLRADARLPGETTLTFLLSPLGPDRTRLTSLVRFTPDEPWGRVYWYAVKPLHAFVFRGMLAGIGRAAGTPFEWTT